MESVTKFNIGKTDFKYNISISVFQTITNDSIESFSVA